MWDKLKSIDGRKPAVAILALTLGLGSAACGNVNFNSSNDKLEACGGAALYTNRGSRIAITSIKAMLHTASQEALELLSRSNFAGGSIDLPRYPGITEISSTKDNLSLHFPSQDREPFQGSDDTLVFNFNDGKPDIKPGTIACTENNGIFPNVAYTSLELYVKDTASLGK